uniref:Uncharacterized protein n=1 Tax=Craspedostauros australis TaxID=1486917 RepID=A0A7R9WY52_9STRA|mmetsp:Transcript_23413/g.65338  ORF Transcript_23413/g.65338 Transcript_23413/m.65338 type:complete len:124 (+) Transcript_23413:171-542(+)
MCPSQKNIPSSCNLGCALNGTPLCRHQPQHHQQQQQQARTPTWQQRSTCYRPNMNPQDPLGSSLFQDAVLLPVSDTGSRAPAPANSFQLLESILDDTLQILAEDDTDDLPVSDFPLAFRPLNQ